MKKERSGSVKGVATQAPRVNWTCVDTTIFDIANNPLGPYTLTQGLAYDPKTNRVFFSGCITLPVLSQAGFSRGNVDYIEDFAKKFLFPADLTRYGINHVGCIDVLDGEILAPLEDKRYAGENYLNPMLATFDPETFAYTGKHALLPRDEEQDNGVPWVAADAAHGVVYTSKYSPERLNIFPIASLWSSAPFREQLQLSRRLRDVQAGKVLDGHLYVISEEEVKVIDLTDGTVSDVHLGDYLPKPDNPDYFYEWEHEGLAFFHGEKGSFLHVTAIRSLGGPDIIYPIPTSVVVFDFKVDSK